MGSDGQRIQLLTESGCAVRTTEWKRDGTSFNPAEHNCAIILRLPCY